MQTELEILKNRIKDTTSIYLEDASLYILSNRTNIHIQVLRSLRDKKRLLRRFHWKKISPIIKIEDPILEKFLDRIEEILTQRFNEYYKKYIKLIKYVMKRTGTYKVNTYIDVDDLTQEVFKTLWRRIGDIDKDCHPKAAIYNYINRVISLTYKSKKVWDKDKYTTESLDKDISSTSGKYSLKEKLSDNTQEENLKQIEIQLNLNYLMKELTPRETRIIKKRHGLDRYAQYSLRELEEFEDITYEAIRLIQNKAEKKIKEKAKKERNHD